MISPFDSKFIKTGWCKVKTVTAKVYFEDGNDKRLKIKSKGFDAFIVSRERGTYMIKGK